MLRVEIIGAESLGVRGLCCLVTTDTRRIVIDPGVSLGYLRHRLLPHPLQIAEGCSVRSRIVESLAAATDVVVSHFHGDHVPLADANPYQLSFDDLPQRPSAQRWWGLSDTGSSSTIGRRLDDLARLLGDGLRMAEGSSAGPMTFSKPVPHGLRDGRSGTVMMTRIACGADVFVHASDVQLLERETVDEILAWAPSIVLAAGPPLYLPALSRSDREVALQNAVRLATNVQTVILDHHLMRSLEGAEWLDQASEQAGRRVVCAADYMERPRQLLEARREDVYRWMPVPADWHECYIRGEVGVEAYVKRPHSTGHEGAKGARATC
jgi:hypothetical protein